MTYTPWTGRIPFSSEQSEVTAVTSTAPNMILVPLDSSPNQSFQTTLFVDGRNITLGLDLSYNDMAGYWTLRISDPVTGQIILDSIPLVTGEYPAANLLGQYAYLGIGSAFVIPVGGSSLDYPDDASLGNSFALIWGDTP